MNVGKLNDWLQLAAALGVIAGLALVAYELRQNQELTRAQLNSETVNALENFAFARQQEALARAIAKTRDAPLELTGTERIMLDGYYKHAFTQVFREAVLIERGIYDDNLDDYMGIFAMHVLDNAYGQVWFDHWIDNVLTGPLQSRLKEFCADWIDRSDMRTNDELKQQLRDKFEN